ncbi:RDD family protein [Actinorugispora endophytica]|uniref:RDD family protein n=1 Tax=Actinorugispora endophytica TaxID=1605990 RepID=A0A4R6UY99_9ACTN|nr:RDD family protein [Actinorugispora endophytica]TDQ52472.1 RDD family protein [Actinorugispora endophytica]
MGESRGHDGRIGAADGDGGSEFHHRGSRLGLPVSGPGSVPGFGRRLAALVVDWFVAAFLATLLFGAPSVWNPRPEEATGGAWWLPIVVFALLTIVLLSLFGTTFGKRLVGVRIAATGERPLPWPVAMMVRTALLCLVIPAVVYDRDQRGLHDRAAGTVSRRF